MAAEPPAPAAPARPDFLCLGAHKAGTTWLARNLWSHPQVWMPYSKELHHFTARHAEREEPHRRRLGRQIRQAIKRARKGRNQSRIAYLRALRRRDDAFSDAWYQSVFAPCPRHQKTGEVTPFYAALDEAGLDDIKRSAPQAKILYLIREPGARAQSALRMALKRAQAGPAAGRSVEETARAWLEKPEAKARGAYADVVPRLDARWGEGEILYLPYGWVRDAPLKLMQSVEAHLGLRPSESWPKLTERVHAGQPATLPDFALEAIEAEAARHRDFLAERFGEAFADATR
ncbi:MAG: sulfotransferase [Pseudomonadota bacterium]